MRVRHRLGDLAGASALYESALEIDRNLYGPDDPHLATVANNSAMTLVELGKLPQAKARFEWAVSVYRKTYGNNHPKIASVMNNLGFVLMQMKDFAGAREWLTQSLAITEATYGANHPQVACIAVNLGGRCARRRNMPRRGSFSIGRCRSTWRRLGERIRWWRRDLLNLAQLLSDQGNFDEAVRLMERALAITEASFGREHRETVLCLKELGRALKGTGDVNRAVECLMRASAISGKTGKAPSHETVVGDEGMLA